MEDPLLPEVSGSAVEAASVSGAVFNISTSIIGAGIMSIPATLKVLGMVPALLLICAVGLLADMSVELLLRFTQAGVSRSYAGVMAEAFGRLGSTALQICIIMITMGCLIVYLIIIGDVLSGTNSGGILHMGILQEWCGVHWWTARPFVLLFILIFILLPLGLFRRVDSLRFTSAVSVLLAVVFVVISSAMAMTALFRGTVQRPRLLPELTQATSFLDLFTAVPVIVTAFTFHFNVHPIRAELSKSSDMATAVRVSVILCSVIYAAVGFFGYLLFGDLTMADILANFDSSSASAQISPLLNDIVRLSYALHLVLVFPLLNFSLRINLDGLLFTKSQPLASDGRRFLLITGFLLAATYIAAIAIPDIWSFFQFVGSTAAVCLSFVFPGAIVLRDINGISTKKDRAIAQIMVVLAVITSSVAITSNVINIFKSKT